MKAVIFKKPGKIAIEDRPKPEIKNPDDILLKVRGIGICGTDLHIMDERALHPGNPDMIMGHEYTAVVEEVGSAVTEFKKGDTVIVDPHPACGKCEFCREDRPDRCTDLYFPIDYEKPDWRNHPNTRGIFRDGAMTSYTVVPAHSVYHIKKEVPFQLAALAEPVNCVLCGINKMNVKIGDTACVVGAGPIGLLFVSMLKMAGCIKVIVSEPSAYRREKALKCGATRVVDPKEEDIIKVVQEETAGDGVDIAVEAVGDKLDLVLSLVRNCGKVMHFGHDEVARPEIRVGQITRKDLEIYGAFIGKYSMKRTAELIESGALPLEEIATHTMPITQVEEAVKMLRAGQGIKIVLTPVED